MIHSIFSRAFPRLLAAASLLLIAPVYAQTTSTAPQSTAAQPANSGVTIKSDTHLVVVDVTVVDSKGNALHGLKATDFTVLDKGEPQTLKSFEEHSAVAPQKQEKMPPLGPDIFTNYTPNPQNSAVNILLLDSLNTPMKDQTYVRDQMIKYLKELPSGTRIAIFGLTTRLIILQGFTQDPEILKAILNGKKNLSKGSPLLDDPTGNGTPESMSDQMADAGFGNDPTTAQAMADLQQFEAQTATYQIQLRVDYTLEAMNQLARYLIGIPGRKNLIWFSGSFPLNILPDGDLQDPFAAMADFSDQMRETADLLTRSQVAVFPVDARGLMVLPMFSASQANSKYGRSPSLMIKDISSFQQTNEQEHFTMDQLADETGGKAFYNTNGLKEAVAKAINFGANYYTLAFSPTNIKWTGEFRKLTVKLSQGGYTLYYRHGYFADDPSKPATHAMAIPAHNAMSTAMLRGGPDPTQIIFKVRALPGASGENVVAQNNSIQPKTKGPYRRYLLDYAADPRNIAFQATPDGVYHGAVEFTVIVYDAEGNMMNYLNNSIRANLSTENYAKVLRTGLPFHQEISVPEKGEYFLRLGIHDMTADRVGAVEIPVVNIKDLSAPAVPAPAAPAVKK